GSKAPRGGDPPSLRSLIRSALAILVVFFQPRLEHKQFRERRVRVQRPFTALLLPRAQTFLPALARAAAVLLSRLLPAAMASEARPLFACSPLATICAAILESVPPGAGL